MRGRGMSLSVLMKHLSRTSRRRDYRNFINYRKRLLRNYPRATFFARDIFVSGSCIWGYVLVCVCMFLCVCMPTRERERERGGGGESERNSQRERETLAVSHHLSPCIPVVYYGQHKSNFTAFSSWAPCTRRCGSGLQLRVRICLRYYLPALLGVTKGKCNGQCLQYKRCQGPPCQNRKFDVNPVEIWL